MRALPLTARRISVSLAFSVFVAAGWARAEDGATQANRIAYEASMRCFVAEGSIAGRRKDAGDTRAQAAYEARARTSFDTAVKLGQVLGYTGNRINQDFALTQTQELPKLVRDADHLKRVMATCDTLGL